MGKKLLGVVVLVALFVIGLASLAQAAVVVYPNTVNEPLLWRTHRATYTTATAGVKNDFGTADACDSTISTRLGAQTAILDTTTAINTLNWPRPNPFVLTAADTNFTWCTLVVSDAGAASSSTADSLYVTTQASFDGVAWFTLATLAGGTAGSVNSRLDQTQGAGTFIGLLNKLGASGGTPTWAHEYKIRTPNTQAMDRTWIWKYPLLRFIVGFPDAVNYSVKASVVHQTTVSEF